MQAQEKNSRGSSRGAPHLYNLVFRVDELDLRHVDAHGIARLFCLLSREIKIRRHDSVGVGHLLQPLYKHCRINISAQT